MDHIKPPTDPYERKLWLVFMLGLKKSSYAALAREQGVSRNVVRKAVYHPYPKMERVIAAKIGYVPELIWPERYKSNLTEQYRNIPGDSTRKPKSKNRY
mgnify:CR=1 FL=1